MKRRKSLLSQIGIKKHRSFTDNIKGTNFFKDNDGDGVINILDCRPNNPRLQHLKPNKKQRERINLLNIVVEDKLTKPRKFYHILSKEAKHKAPVARMLGLKMIKKYPHFLKEIEQKKNLNKFVIKSWQQPGEHGHLNLVTRIVEIGPSQFEKDYTKQGWLKMAESYVDKMYEEPDDRKYQFMEIKRLAERKRFKDESYPVGVKKRIRSMALTGFHELTHVDQVKTPAGYHKVAYEATHISKHWKRKSELEADEVANRKEAERFKTQKFDNPFKLLDGFKDSDKDGVVNVLDCQPYNPKKQDAEPNEMMAEEIKKTPFYVTEESYDTAEETDEDLKKKRFHVLSKEAKKKAPIARKRMLSIIKKNPSIVGATRRSRVGALVYTTQGNDDVLGLAEPEYPIVDEKGKMDLETPRHTVIIYGGTPILKEEDYPKGKKHLEKKVRKYYKKYNIPDEKAEKYIKRDLKRIGHKIARSRSETVGHELKHVEQFNKIQEIANEKGEEAALKYYKKLMKGNYEERMLERQARQAGKEFVGQRYRATYGSRKYFTDQLNRTLNPYQNDMKFV